LQKAAPEIKARALEALRRFQPLLEPFGAIKLALGHSGADVSPMVGAGVPGIGVEHVASHYFDIHHTQADTFDKVAKDDLAFNAAVLATFAYALAESDLRFN
jgi:carboxypeptidase Q